MVALAFAFTLQALWITLSPYPLSKTLFITVMIITLLILTIWGINYRPFLYNQILRLEHGLPLISAPLNYLKRKIQESALKGTYFYVQRNTQHQLFFFIVGIILSTPLYLSALNDYRTILQSLPVEVEAQYRVIYNSSPYSTTIEIIKPLSSEDFTNEQALQALKGAQVRIYSLPQEIKKVFKKGATYQGSLQLRARFFRSMPGNQQQILRVLARKEIGYGKILSPPIEIAPPNKIENIRQNIAQSLIHNYLNGAYMSALSVGKSEALTQNDWQVLRKTGTIHLVSISGLHLTLTAFYAFVLFRVFFALIGWRRPAPYKIAALFSIGIAWAYALFAGMSLPTIRAAIMFSIAMLSLIIERPIFTLNSIALALLIILSIWPLSLLTPGFWLSFIAVTILTLTARIVNSSFKGLVISQLIISLLLMPLTATFFKEVSLISPVINLFAIPWTSLMIMPTLLLGTILLLFSKLLALPFLLFTNQSITILRYAIEIAANIPFASVETASITLEIALIGTLISLWLLSIFPLISQKKKRMQYHWSLKKGEVRTIVRSLLPVTLLSIMLVSIVLLNSLQKNTSRIFAKKSDSIVIRDQKEQVDQKKNILSLYLLPVGEGLSLYLELNDFNLLYDSGNRFGAFDAGRDVIIPFLKKRRIDRLNTLILTHNNQQHIGGTRALRESIPIDNIFAHHSVGKMIDHAEECYSFSHQSPIFSIEPITYIRSSCAYRLSFENHIRLYLLSDINSFEWRNFVNTLKQEMRESPIKKLILLYPNQGRSRFNIDLNQILMQEEEDHHSMILLSTKFPRKELTSTDNIQYYNAYFGTIEVILTTENGQELNFKTKNYADSERYWWVQYNNEIQ